MKNLPENDTLWAVFDLDPTHPNNPYCHWFNSKKEANEFLSQHDYPNYSKPIKYVRDY